MLVHVYQIEKGRDKAVGTISWNGISYSMDPSDSQLLHRIIDIPIYIGGKMLTKRDGEDFLSNLYRQYGSAYLRVGRAEGGTFTRLQPSRLR